MFRIITFISLINLTGQLFAIEHSEVVSDIVKNVLQKDAKTAHLNLDLLKRTISRFKDQPSQSILVKIQEDFLTFMQTWKAVEALYIAGFADESLIDHVRLVDGFHHGNEDLPQQLERIVKLKDPLNISMFKNSHKSINALEYLLFGQQGNIGQQQWLTSYNLRPVDMALFICDNIAPALKEIEIFYLTDTRLAKRGKKSIDDLVNQLIDSSYKLKTWRLEEPTGIVGKFIDKPSVDRLEYHYSQSSLLAIQSILKTHEKLLSPQAFKNLTSLGDDNRFKNYIAYINKKIEKAQESAAKIKQPLAKALTSQEVKDLYQSTDSLHKAYISLLIDALGIKAKIIDADGD